MSFAIFRLLVPWMAENSGDTQNSSSTQLNHPNNAILPFRTLGYAACAHSSKRADPSSQAASVLLSLSISRLKILSQRKETKKNTRARKRERERREREREGRKEKIKAPSSIFFLLSRNTNRATLTPCLQYFIPKLADKIHTHTQLKRNKKSLLTTHQLDMFLNGMSQASRRFLITGTLITWQRLPLFLFLSILLTIFSASSSPTARRLNFHHKNTFLYYYTVFRLVHRYYYVSDGGAVKPKPTTTTPSHRIDRHIADAMSVCVLCVWFHSGLTRLFITGFWRIKCERPQHGVLSLRFLSDFPLYVWLCGQ